MPKPISATLLLLCEAVELAGPSNTATIAEKSYMDRWAAEKYCMRAVVIGAMTVDRSQKPKQYAIVPGWLELLTKRHEQRYTSRGTERKKAAPVICRRSQGIVLRALRTQPNSVFELPDFV